MKHILPITMLLSLLIFHTNIVVGQGNVYISSDWDAERERFNIIGNNETNKFYTVVLDIENVVGLVASTKFPSLRILYPGEKRLLLTLDKIGKTRPNYTSKHRIFEGVANPEVDLDVRYVLPVSDGMTTSARFAQQIKDLALPEEAKSGQREKFNLVFSLIDGDTICTARSGLVEQVKQEGQRDVVKYDYVSDRNYIIVRHKDGTLARYSQFKNGSAMVQVGDEILAGQPLALAEQSSKMGDASLFFSVYYLKLNFESDLKSSEWSSFGYVKPIFKTKAYEGALAEGVDYQAYVDESLKLQEMSKREIRRYKKGKN